MRQALLIHPDSPRGAVGRVEAEAARQNSSARQGALRLRFILTGTTPALRLPPFAAPGRADELWRATCFEAFIRAGAGPAYVELNFSPSTQWAAYQFSGYREGMRSLELAAPPSLVVNSSASSFELDAALEFGPSVLPPNAPWRLGLCAILEHADGGKSYWALAHPPGAPDFHHRDGCRLELADAERT
jgi:hypothetical protein